ncbi:MAG: helix-turn-helix transcriptional regulator, partial [Lachnospiraceae bacterium]|nr:helix-turn-helix transcriptional regulator [Lachnospiraceae bacterium]
MEWLSAIRTAIDYMENHLTDNISAQDVAGQVFLSPFFLQRGFSLMTGYGIGEYIRNRRLYLAALDLQRTDEKVIDIALRYGYETPESFTKAFSRFHGATPSQVRDGATVNVFIPLTIKLSIQGGHQMEYKVTPMFPIKVIGFQKVFDNETAYAEIPK